MNKLNLISKIDFKRNRENYIQELDAIFKQKYDRVVVWRGNFGWNVPLYQRPQHMAKHMSNNKTLILYEVTKFTDKVKTVKKVNNNLYLVNFNNIDYSNNSIACIFVLFTHLKCHAYTKLSYNILW